jgi:hypothetical protein
MREFLSNSILTRSLRSERPDNGEPLKSQTHPSKIKPFNGHFQIRPLHRNPYYSGGVFGMVIFLLFKISKHIC